MNIPNNYKPFVGIVLLFAIVSLLNIPILTTLWRHSFDDGTYSHAYLIPFIVLYLYFKLSEIGKLVYRDKVSLLSISMLLASGYALFVTSNAQISIGFWLSFLALTVVGINTLFRFNWYVIFPACFLIFIFPLWGVLTNVLQDVSVIAVTYMMSFTGIPTYVEAQYITIPSGVFEIADGCSGLRYIIVSLAISSLFIFLYINNVRKALIFLSIAILGALITNWIRITALILIGDYTEMQSSLMEDHNTFGWYLYIPFMFLLFMWGNKLTTIDLLNTKSPVNLKNYSPVKFNVLLVLFSFLIFSTSAKYLLSHKQPLTEHVQNIEQLQPEVFNATSISILNFPPVNNINLITYRFDGANLDGKPTHFNNQLIPLGWKIKKHVLLSNWNINIVTKNRQNALVLYQYEIDNQKSSTIKDFKVNRLLKALKGKSETQLHWGFLPCIDNCETNLIIIKKQIELIN